MSQADFSNSTPATGETLSGLARQQHERETTLRTLAMLRRDARAEIERLITFLDLSDEYAATELEDQVDDGPCDTDELEISEGDDEPDGDDEPSLAAPEKHPAIPYSTVGYFGEPVFYGPGGIYRDGTGSQHGWAIGGRDDREDEHDGTEPDADREPSLGWTADGELGDVSDCELDDCDREDGD